MIEIEIPKDISKYEAKLIGPFTTRQLACFILGVVVVVPFYIFMSNFLPRDAVSLLSIILAAPFIAVGWVKLYGMKFEQFVKTAFISNVLAPKRRKYVSKNVYDYVEFDNYDEKFVKDSKVLNGKEMRKEMKKKVHTNIKYYV